MAVIAEREDRFRTPRVWWLIAFLALAIALYGWLYVVRGENAFAPDFAASFRATSPTIFIHTLFGPLALLSGAIQFLPAMRRPGRWSVHRFAGRVYVIAAIVLATAGLYLSLYSLGGMVTHVGFALLAIGTLSTTVTGYVLIRRGKVRKHLEWMLRSYCFMFGAVTLRIWLPLLIIAMHGEFVTPYRIVAWLSWVPNILFGEWLIRRGWRPVFRIDPTSPKLQDASWQR